MMTPEVAWAEAMRFENRANPFPFFDELRKTPVAQVDDEVNVGEVVARISEAD